ncbi:hypothetical protein MTR_6g055485 [Medicago truncatula]|uniref:Uncharacterized protein n=1 Tax=Medicago truncatula TaxID=3880 RepID=A0A072U9E6_MEDTR|nr:hypothetical protein MTR_6g055485 [Medicago truncatula]
MLPGADWGCGSVGTLTLNGIYSITKQSLARRPLHKCLIKIQSKNIVIDLQKQYVRNRKAITKFSSRYVSEHIRHTREKAHTTSTILGYLQVTHTKSNIFKQKG